ncbi:hypothetical protein BFS35_000160 [Macrococcoides goetzii]|uniref:Uncharacterized protein n=1 Tax=Macrococcoides goetzii TaxID=1891097 RepID=A0A2G5NNS6_9STAP|nr:hypothetical protein [Macrococcus goetzii]RAI82131.1 hypothetical protein BFS35_000160 [Macrococcus goetzii]
MDNITINSFASTVGINLYDHTSMFYLLQDEYPDTDEVPTGEIFKKIERIELKENEGYFVGSIELISNDEIIIPKSIHTGDLYLLWHDLYLSTTYQSYEFSYLDNNYTIKTEIITDQIKFQIQDTELNKKGKRLTENVFVEDINQYVEEVIQTHSFHLEDYKSAVIEGLITFFEHLNHDFKRNKFDSPYYFDLEKFYKSVMDNKIKNNFQ